MANQIIPQRSEVPEEYTWNLKDKRGLKVCVRLPL